MAQAKRKTTTLATDKPANILGDDALLLELGARLEAAWASERRQLSAVRVRRDVDTPKHKRDDREFEARYKATSGIVDQIEVLHAHTLEGLRVKARAISWCHSGDPVILFDDDQNTTDLRLTQSILNDLMRMPAGARSA